MKKIILICVICVNLCNLCYSQGIYNNGATIVIPTGVVIYIDGDANGGFLNAASGGDGEIDIDGTIIVEGDWTNNASNNVLTSGGSYMIQKEQNHVIVYDNTVSKDSRVFVSMLTDPGARSWISKKDNGMFMISLNSPAENDVSFDYFVDNAVIKPETANTSKYSESKDEIKKKAKSTFDDQESDQPQVEPVRLDDMNSPPPEPPDPDKAWLWTQETGFKELVLPTYPQNQEQIKQNTDQEIQEEQKKEEQEDVEPEK